MITSSTNLKNIFYNNTQIESDVGCYIEYNMNSLLDNINVTTTANDSDYISQISVSAGTTVRLNPYKKLFPIDSIAKPFRPLNSGIKYYIFGDTKITSGSFSSPKLTSYPTTEPRLYYPGVTTTYKYWVTPKGDNADVTVTYSNGSTKYAVTNKIVLRFEKYHQLPSNYTITITKSDNSTITVGPYNTTTADEYIIYYNGTSWSNTAPSEPISYGDPISIKSIRLQATNPSVSGIIGVIEVSARWIKDISSDVVSFDINKESSSETNSILPVGYITSNSFNLNLTKYNASSISTISYNRNSNAQFDTSLIYLAKNVELIPFFKIYHSNGAITSGSRKYDKIIQGKFFIDTFSIEQYGDSLINALDSSKYLMETIAPEILCEGYPVTAILRRLLDSIGFTNYNFNMHSTSETSIPLIQYWWTDGTKTVWQALQELCRDIQMNAYVDENGILQFYSRDYMYSQTTPSWNFYYEKEGTLLPNIISISSTDIASANQVKVLWQVPIKTIYTGSSSALWTSPPSFLSAGGLRYPIDANTTAENTILIIELSTIDQYIQQQSLYNFNGYMLIDSEIIEFDAIQFQYVPIDSITNTSQTFWATSATDLNKYKYLSKSGYADLNKPESAYFKPTGRYRVKTRGALGTSAAAHSATSAGVSSVWDEVSVPWQ